MWYWGRHGPKGEQEITDFPIYNVNAEDRFSEGWSEPPLTREEAGVIYGQALSDAQWGGVLAAFRDYTSRRVDIAALRDSKSKKSEIPSWYRTRDQVVSRFRTIETHLKRLGALGPAKAEESFGAVFRAPRDVQMSEFPGLRFDKDLESIYWTLLLNDQDVADVLDAVERKRGVIERAEPPGKLEDAPTLSNARAHLAYNLRKAIGGRLTYAEDRDRLEGGKAVRRPKRRLIEREKRALEAMKLDLTPCEQLLAMFGLRAERQNDYSFAQWLHKSTSEKIIE